MNDIQSIITQQYAFLRFSKIQKPIIDTVARIKNPTRQDLEAIDAGTFALQNTPDIMVVKKAIEYLKQHDKTQDVKYNLDTHTFFIRPKSTKKDQFTIHMTNFLTFDAFKNELESKL